MISAPRQYLVLGGGAPPQGCRSRGNAVITAHERTVKQRNKGQAAAGGPVVVLDTLLNEIIVP